MARLEAPSSNSTTAKARCDARKRREYVTGGRSRCSAGLDHLLTANQEPDPGVGTSRRFAYMPGRRPPERAASGRPSSGDCHEEDARRCRTRGHTSHDLANSSEGPTVPPARGPASPTDRTDLYRDPGEDNLLVRPSTGDRRVGDTAELDHLQERLHRAHDLIAARAGLQGSAVGEVEDHRRHRPGA
jgi:hypothetical protein